jgi:hypothetical protein
MSYRELLVAVRVVAGDRGTATPRPAPRRTTRPSRAISAEQHVAERLVRYCPRTPCGDPLIVLSPDLRSLLKLGGKRAGGRLILAMSLGRIAGKPSGLRAATASTDGGRLPADLPSRPGSAGCRSSAARTGHLFWTPAVSRSACSRYGRGQPHQLCRHRIHRDWRLLPDQRPRGRARDPGRPFL